MQTLAAIAKTAHNNATGEKAPAKTLLEDASKALAAMIKAARADTALDPKTPKNKPVTSDSPSENVSTGVFLPNLLCAR